MEHFGTESDLEGAFVTVAGGVDGPVVVCADDPGSREVGRRTGATTYGLDANSDWRMIDLTRHDGGTRFELVGPSARAHVSLGRPGAHVALNAAGALALLGSMGRDIATAAMGLASFRGVGRRWEHRGTVSGVTLIDDYAHHPTEVAATVGVGETWRGGGCGPCSSHISTAGRPDSTKSSGQRSAARTRSSSQTYTGRGRIQSRRHRCHRRRCGASSRGHCSLRPPSSRSRRLLAARAAEGDLVLTMGAGDITLVPTELAMRLAERS